LGYVIVNIPPLDDTIGHSVQGERDFCFDVLSLPTFHPEDTYIIFVVAILTPDQTSENLNVD
jgi:hypothetical protein